jgi:hypothetical protein
VLGAAGADVDVLVDGAAGATVDAGGAGATVDAGVAVDCGTGVVTIAGSGFSTGAGV